MRGRKLIEINEHVHKVCPQIKKESPNEGTEDAMMKLLRAPMDLFS